MDVSTCPTPATLRASFAWDLGARERAEIEEHLSFCRDCRRRLAALAREVVHGEAAQREPARVPPRLLAVALALPGRRRGAYWGTGLAVAATILVALGTAALLDAPWRRGDGEPRWRAAPGQGALLRPLAPPPASQTRSPLLEFRWQEIPTAQSYRLVLLDPAGNPLIEVSSREPRATLARPARGERFYWYVSARLDDGSLVESEPAALDWRR